MLMRRLHVITLLLLLASVTACAVKIPTVVLYEPSGATRTSFGTGVLPFEDARPTPEHEGSRTWLIPLVFVNWRRGDWVTADEHFEPIVSDAVALGVAWQTAGLEALDRLWNEVNRER